MGADSTIDSDLNALRDEDLAERVASGDAAAAVHLLVDRCGPGLKYLVQARYRTLGLEVGELVSEMYLLLRRDDWRALRAFRGASSEGRSCKLTHYVHCIASRHLWKKMDRRVKETSWVIPLVDGMDAAVTGQDAARAAEGADLIAAIQALPDATDRAVVMLYKVEQRDVQEVATLLGMTPGNVYTRCSRALSTLRATLGAEKRQE